MIAILLCAGFGTRMYPLTEDRPKPLLQVAGRAILDYLMDQLVEFPELEAIHLASNSRFYGHFVEWQTGWQSRLDEVRIQICVHNDGATHNENRLGATGDLAFVLAATGVPDGAVVAAGDNILRFSLLPLWQQFRATRKSYVIALPEEESAKRRLSAVLELGEGDRVMRLHEKPEHPASSLTCPALYFLRSTALRRVHDLHAASDREASHHLITSLVQKEPIYAFRVNASRFHIGSVETYEETNRILRHEPVIRA